MSRRALVLVLILVGLGCSPEPDATPSGPANPEAAPSEPKAPAKTVLTRVEPHLVCMMNDQFIDAPQPAVEVAGTTYYGCSEMCRTRLVEEPASRSAIDPVSGGTVDKAHAVIGKDDTNAVFYFENEQNLAAYVEPAR